MANQDFTGAAWVTVNGDSGTITEASPTNYDLTITTLSRDESTYCYNDVWGSGGSDGEFIHRFRFKVTATNNVWEWGLWAISSEIGDTQGWEDGSTADWVRIAARQRPAVGAPVIEMEAGCNGVKHGNGDSRYVFHIEENIYYYITVQRNGDLVGCEVRVESHTGLLVWSHVIDVSALSSSTYRYVQASQSRDDGYSARYVSGVIGNYDLDVSSAGRSVSELIANPRSSKVVLLECDLAEQVVGWSLAATYTYTYEKDCGNDPISLADGSSDYIYKVITDVKEDGVSLTHRANVDDVESNAGSWYQNPDDTMLNIHTTGSDSPAGYTIVIYFTLHLSTQGLVTNNHYYEPYIAANGLPTLSRRNPNIHWGISEISSGSVKLINNNGYFDQAFRKYLWTNKPVRLLLGSPTLPYVEFLHVFTGKIVDKTFTQQDCSLEIKSNSFDLLRQIPDEVYDTTTYANLDPNAAGKPIPIFYGSYSESQAPEATCINTAYAADTYQFRLCSHAIDSITQVYVDYDDGDGWQTISHSNENLTNATFTIYSTTFTVGTSKIKVAFDGKLDGGSSLLENGPHIVEDLLTSICGYSSDQLNDDAFTASKAQTTADLNVPIITKQSVLSVIERICASELAYFDEDGNGKLRYRIWEATLTGTLPEITSADFVGTPEITDDISTLYWKVDVGYSFSCTRDQYLYHSESDESSKFKYDKSEELTLDTYIRGQAAAETLAERVLLVTKTPSPIMIAPMKIPVIDQTLGDRVRITLERAPHATGVGFQSRQFELYGLILSFFPLELKIEARDLMEYANYRGMWTGSSAPNWGAATDEEKLISGFWTDDDGYADPGPPPDDDSLNKSIWW